MRNSVHTHEGIISPKLDDVSIESSGEVMFYLSSELWKDRPQFVDKERRLWVIEGIS